jgi:hypothetical protein
MTHSIVRTFLVSGAAAGLMAGVAACSCSVGSSSHSVSKSDVASQITSKLTDAAGNKPDSVTCPDNLKGVVGATLRCQLTDNNQKYGVSVNVTGVDAGDVNFDFKVDERPS